MPTSPKKKSAKKTSVKINKVQQPKLVDERILNPDSGRMIKVVLTTLFVGLVVSGGLLAYFLYYAPVADVSDYSQQIVVPRAPDRSTDVSEQETKVPEVVVEVQYITILDTPTGYLNVRKGPGTNFAKIAQVNPGERYELVLADEVKKWYEIRLSDATIGWVSGQYAKIDLKS